MPANSLVTVNGQRLGTKSTDTKATIETTPIGDGRTHSYAIEVRFESGRTQKKSIYFRAGESVTVEFDGRLQDYPLNLSKIKLALPEMENNDFAALLRNPRRTVFYKLPQVYQRQVSANASALFSTDVLRDFNANLDFPWETTIGLNTSHKQKHSPYDTVNFVTFPVDDKGDIIPILVIDDEVPVKWIFPPQITFGEIIFAEYEGRKWVQEIRTRTKDADSKGIEPGVFRPILDRADFVAKIGKFYAPAKKYFHFRNPEEDEVVKLEGFVERLPELDAPAVKRLLSLPFKQVLSSWSEISHSPTSDIDFHILPKDYSFGLLKAKSTTCVNCHRQTMIGVDRLIPREPSIGLHRSKVGTIRGSDGIFTWHPFDIDCTNTTERGSKALKLRQYDLEQRYVVRSSSRRVDANAYKLSLFVEKSLGAETLPSKRFLHLTSER